MRKAGLWEYFKNMVSIEYQMLQYQKMGFSFEFKSESELVNEKGRVINPVAEETPVKYVITVKDKDGNSLVENFTSTIYPLET